MGSTQWAVGSASTRMARMNRLNGTARRAPIAPRAHAQKISESRVIVGDRPTASPT